jgi:hypothetical protein
MAGRCRILGLLASVVTAAAIPTAASGAAHDIQTTSDQPPPTEFIVDRTSIIVPSLLGYGAQFNHSAFYTRLNPALPSAGLATKLTALQPRLVRIFFPVQALTDWTRLASFQQVVDLAQAAGSTIEVTWSGGYSSIDSNMTRLASALADIVEQHHVTNLRWVSLLNEPNSDAWDPAVPKATYERMYRSLDVALRAEGIRDQVHLMGGELVQNGQRAWLDYMVDHMSDLLDAYSIHVYWDYWDAAKLESRLNEVRAIDLRTGPKPLYVTEFGVRGDRQVYGVAVPQPGIWADDTTPMAQTNVSAFQLAWFNILASRLGYPGTVTWDAFNAKYDNGTQDFSCIGPAPDYAIRPCYSLLQLFTVTTEPGWRVLGVSGFDAGKLLTAYEGSAGRMTVIGLDRAGAVFNADSGVGVPYTVGGLPPSASFRLVVWNGDGSGRLADAGLVTTDPSGIAVLTVPQHAVWALTR